MPAFTRANIARVVTKASFASQMMPALTMMMPHAAFIASRRRHHAPPHHHLVRKSVRRGLQLALFYKINRSAVSDFSQPLRELRKENAETLVESRRTWPRLCAHVTDQSGIIGGMSLQ
jgi:hypothetical protein